MNSSSGWRAFTLIAGLCTASLAAPSGAQSHQASHEKHGHQAPHGGLVVTVGKYHYEMVLKHQAVYVYLLDGKENTLPLSGVEGSAVFQIPGRETKSAILTPSADHLSAALDLDEVEHFIAVVSLKIEGKTRIGRFSYQKSEAHAHHSPHGGEVRAAGEYHVEFVADPEEGEIEFYFYDKAMKPLSAGAVSGRASLRFAGGETRALTLAVAEGEEGEAEHHQEGEAHEAEHHQEGDHAEAGHHEPGETHLVAKVDFRAGESFELRAELSVREKRIGALSFHYPGEESKGEAHEAEHHQEGDHAEAGHH